MDVKADEDADADIVKVKGPQLSVSASGEVDFIVCILGC